jgi:hypothetical protein
MLFLKPLTCGFLVFQSGERPSIVRDALRKSPPFLHWIVADSILPDMYEDIALEFDRFTSPVPLMQEVLDEAQGDLPVFRNLTTLLLDQCYIASNNLQTLWRFLLHTPMLEKLTLHCCKVILLMLKCLLFHQESSI